MQHRFPHFHFVRTTFLFLAAFLISTPTPVFALKDSVWDRFDLDNIFYYDPDGVTCTTTEVPISGSSVTLIGDSLSVGAKSEFSSQLSGIDYEPKTYNDKTYNLIKISKHFAIDAKDNYSGLTIAKQLKANSALRPYLVFALGTNDPGAVTSSSIKKLVDAVGSSQKIILVTAATDNSSASTYSSNNKAIREAADKYENIMVADWEKAISSNPKKYISDSSEHVHLNSEGNRLFVKTIHDALNKFSSTGSTGDNKLYNGKEVLSEQALKAIEENRPFYEKAAEKYGFNWQILAVLHYREASSVRYNPANGQGAYQLYSYTNGGTNENRFEPGKITDEEFQRQTDIVAKQIKERFSAGLDLSTDDGIKTMFFRFNGVAASYIAQARSLGYSETEAKRGEGSPYVMNLADKTRDSSVNSNWKQILTDHGSMQRANQVPGAFIIYSALGGSNGISNCSSGAQNGDINATAIKLAWPEHGHGLTARDTYKEALQETGISSYSDHYAAMGASCDAFVATVMRYSGADPDFVCCGVSNYGATYNYVVNSGKYVEVPNSLDSLQPGDIRMSNGHIELYIEVDGVGKIASASYGSRTGEIGNFYENSATFKAYRLKK